MVAGRALIHHARGANLPPGRRTDKEIVNLLRRAVGGPGEPLPRGLGHLLQTPAEQAQRAAIGAVVEVPQQQRRHVALRHRLVHALRLRPPEPVVVHPVEVHIHHPQGFAGGEAHQRLQGHARLIAIGQADRFHIHQRIPREDAHAVKAAVVLHKRAESGVHAQLTT